MGPYLMLNGSNVFNFWPTEMDQDRYGRALDGGLHSLSSVDFLVPFSGTVVGHQEGSQTECCPGCINGWEPHSASM